MLTNRGAKFLDFGLAKLSRAVSRSRRELVGSVVYFAPENIRGERADFCSNIFTLGAITYEMATGTSPFPGDDPATLMRSILLDSPGFPVAFNSEFSRRLQGIICKALEKDKRKRYQNAMEMLADFQPLQSELVSGEASFKSPKESPGRTVANRAELLPRVTETTLADRVRGVVQRLRPSRVSLFHPTMSTPILPKPEATSIEKMTLRPGDELGPFEILSPLGAGGMGEVYRAIDNRLDRIVALKILPERLLKRTFRERFEREARAISYLNHPNICQLYDLGQHNRVSYLVMECLIGKSLATALKAGPLSLDKVLRHGIEVADALDTAHHFRIIHRDVKPSNLFLTDHGECKVLDFGLAKLGVEILSEMPTASGSESLSYPGAVVGTPGYMSPEQARGEPVDERTDIFSFGAVLYQMSTGVQPFRGRTAPLMFKAILDERPPSLQNTNPRLPHRLDEIIQKALEKDPDARYRAASDLLDDLRELKEDLSGPQ